MRCNCILASCMCPYNTCTSAAMDASFVNLHAENNLLSGYKINVDAFPAHESYEIGSRVTLNCSVSPPQAHRNFTFRHPTHTFSSTVTGGKEIPRLNRLHFGTTNITIPANHPTSADYFCRVYRNEHLLGIGRKTLKVKGITA